MNNHEGNIPMHAIRARRTFWWLVVALGLLPAVLFRHPGSAAELKSSVVRVGFSESAFHGVNRNDAEAAFKAFLVTVGRGRGYDIQTTTQIFDDAPGFEAAIKHSRIELAIIDAWSYLSMDVQEFVDPSFVPLDKGTAGFTYLLLTRKDGRHNTLGSLRGKEILLMQSGPCALSFPWLETLLLGNGLGAQGRFFGRIDVAGKASAAVLPVFFGNKHACVIDAEGFGIMKELNPQLGTKLQVVATSEPLVNHVICLAKSGWPSEQNRQDMMRGLRELDQEPAGQQILTLFKVGQLVPFQETHLDTLRKLRATYDRLRRQKSP
jgi:ABC-type phosphate/phosphonate transport system substrate-binding protein